MKKVLAINFDNIYTSLTDIPFEHLSFQSRATSNATLPDFITLNRLNSTIELNATKLNKFKARVDNACSHNIKLYCKDLAEELVLVTIGEKSFIFPASCVHTQELEDIEVTRLNELVLRIEQQQSSQCNYDRALIQSIPADIADKSIKDYKDELAQKEEDIKKFELEIKKREELIREEMNKKLQEMRAQMSEQLTILQQKKEEMNKELFNMEHFIYRLRSLLGDNTDVSILRKGKFTERETPLVIYQKLHYIDEDLAKLKLTYCGNLEYEFIENAIEKDDEVLNMFCPTQKGISLFKISKDSKTFNYDDNMLTEYVLTHGSRIAILIRDGENVVCIWTEQHKIYLQENLFITEAAAITETPFDQDNIRCVDDLRNDVAVTQLLSRQYISDILDGLRQFSPYVRIDGNILTSSQVIWSSADGWLEDNSYPTLDTVIQQQNTRVGDTIYSFWDLQGQVFTDRWRSEDRGRGNNLARDAGIPKGLNTINLVENEYIDETYSIRKEIIKEENGKFYRTVWDWKQDPDDSTKEIRYQKFEETTEENYSTIKAKNDTIDRIIPILITKLHRFGDQSDVSIREGDIQYSTHIHRAGRGYVWKKEACTNCFLFCHDEKRIYTDCLSLSIFKKRKEPRYYISAEKSWSEKGARANVRIYKDEFLNLTYVTPEMVRFWVSTKKIGERYRNVNFATMVSRLHQINEYVANRRKAELIIVSGVARKNMEEYGEKLDNWKKQNNVRTITEFQARRFLSSIKELKRQ